MVSDTQARQHTLEAASIEASHQAMKALLLLNGGACIAVLGFLSSIFSAEHLDFDRAMFFNSAVRSLVWFATGAWLSVVTVFLAYLTNQRYAASLMNPTVTWKSAQRLNQLATSVGCLSLMAFAAGVWTLWNPLR